MRYRRGTESNFQLSTAARSFGFTLTGATPDNLLGPSKDRVALIFSLADTVAGHQAWVAPGTDAVASGFGFTLASLQQPLVLTREQLGDVITMQWGVTGTAGHTVTVTEILASGPAEDCECYGN